MISTKKKGRLAIHKIEGFKRRWISQGGRIHIVPLFPIFPWYIITFSICPNYSDVGFPFVHFCGTVFSPLLETWISPFGLDFFPFSNKLETFPYKDPFCPLVMGPAGRLDNNCGAVACRGPFGGPFGARVDGGRLPLTEGRGAGSKRWPPRGKLDFEMTDRSRPSEPRERDVGGLLSSTIN